ncbi:DNA-directed RNA polymerase II rpb5 [Cyclospora cayetanensis]|uniref:DNA-directed RNA polymerase II rpb5 n=1 Tax=Cyclospora cayetanensis TaxID=88456 RepID=A0A1D3D1C7_9EIME|nr:DNA-directed RNA polymerase II rpb5 [Cyclospora cayetanensis]
MESSIRRLFRARRTCCEILEDRGYLLPPQEKTEAFNEFVQRFNDNEQSRSRMLLIASHKVDPEAKVIVYFADEIKKTGVKPIRELTERMEERNIHRAILVTQNVLTAFAKDAIAEAAPRHIIEHFMESELLVNITKHELVPKHVPLSPEDKQQLLQRYRVKEVQLPRIQVADPISRYFGLSRGQVVKIIRPSETAGRYVTYRLVQRSRDCCSTRRRLARQWALVVGPTFGEEVLQQCNYSTMFSRWVKNQAVAGRRGSLR